MDIKDNNPGLLRKFNGVLFIGEATETTNPPYRQFYELIYGYRAMFAMLDIFREANMRTIKEIILAWYGKPKEETQQIIDFICHAINIGSEVPLKLTDEKELEMIVCAITHYNTGKVTNEKPVIEAYKLYKSNKIK
jgi:hypothetical protein